MKSVKDKIKDQQPLIGTMITTFTNPDIANILHVAGLDFFIIDCEHGGFNYNSVANIIGRARLLGIGALVRIPDVTREPILKYMEMGASGLLLPNTETIEQAEKLVEFSKYYPMGNRGVSLFRPHTGYEKVEDAADYMAKANEETVLIIQVESPKCLENIKEILETDGIDGALIGPNDLSQSMGIIGQYDHPLFIKAIEQVTSASKETGKVSGIHLASSPQSLKAYIEKGMTFNMWSNEAGMLMTKAIEGIEYLNK